MRSAIYLTCVFSLAFSGFTAASDLNESSTSTIRFSCAPSYSLESSKESGECHSLLRKDKEMYFKVADICLYAELGDERAKDLGFVSYDEIPGHAKTLGKSYSGYVYTSALSMYAAEEITARAGSGDLAKNVDCDIYGDQPVYRATGICDVAILSSLNGRKIFLNFVIKDNLSGKQILSHAEVVNLVQKLRLSNRFGETQPAN